MSTIQITDSNGNIVAPNANLFEAKKLVRRYHNSLPSNERNREYRLTKRVHYEGRDYLRFDAWFAVIHDNVVRLEVMIAA